MLPTICVSGVMTSWCSPAITDALVHHRRLAPGDGPPLAKARPYVEDLIKRRVEREEAIFQTLLRKQLSSRKLSRTLYSKLDPVLQDAAERNVRAHLAKLESEGKVTRDDEVWFAAPEESAAKSALTIGGQASSVCKPSLWPQAQSVLFAPAFGRVRFRRRPGISVVSCESWAISLVSVKWRMMRS
jgi:hypothetical protein